MYYLKESMRWIKLYKIRNILIEQSVGLNFNKAFIAPLGSHFWIHEYVLYTGDTHLHTRNHNLWWVSNFIWWWKRHCAFIWKESKMITFRIFTSKSKTKICELPAKLFTHNFQCSSYTNLMNVGGFHISTNSYLHF